MTTVLEDTKDLEKTDKSMMYLISGTDLRVFGTYENPLFIAKDIATMLEYKNTSKAIRDHIDKKDIIIWGEYNKKAKLIPKSRIQFHTKLITKKGIQTFIIYAKKHSQELMTFLKDEFDIKFDCIKRLTKETEYINNILKTFDGEKMITQYAIGNYMIDLYFIDYKIAIECDEFFHQSYDKKDEELRQKNIENKLECKFIRFNPDKDSFDIFEVINKIYLLIKLYH